MSGLFSPVLAMKSGWKDTMAGLFQILRRVSFVVEDTFQFGTFDPKTDFLGMTISNYKVNRARYLKIWKFLWISVDIQATAAAPLNSGIVITMPNNYVFPGDGNTYQAFGTFCISGGVGEAGLVRAIGGTSTITAYRTATGNYVAGLVGVSANGFFEVI